MELQLTFTTQTQRRIAIKQAKALGCLTKVRILTLLTVEGEMCVGDIAKKLKLQQNNTSKALSVLENAFLVELVRSDGKRRYYGRT